ncbi:hypothetical protein BaRGS_00023800 [Batillaria attramentaria]|uniref:Protein amnionless n=1 Tax=Batillaria attramentaria TaxID=370345 RepID=A0ABD0KDA4_9CAEN
MFTDLCKEFAVSRLSQRNKIHITKGVSDAVYKRWLTDRNFENPNNWNAGRPPCGNDRVIIPDDSPVIYMQMNTTLRELTLPKNGELILGNGVQLAFTQDAADVTNCPQTGGDVEFTAVHAAKWVDPQNWCATTTELADCQPDSLLETERVPCVTDDVVFLRHRSYYVDLSHDLQLKVKTLKLTGTSFTTDSFTQYVNSTDGRKIFRLSSPGAPTTLSISRQGCNDVGGCACGNDQGQMQQQICAIQSKRCTRAKCKSPVMPVGACCDMCGVVINGTRGRGFNFNDFKNLLQTTFFDNNTDVTTAVSVTSAGNVQVVLQDDSGQYSSQLAALIKADFDADLKNGGHKYALDAYVMTGSAADTSAHTGSPDFKLPHAPNLPSLPNLSRYLPSRSGFGPKRMREPPSGSATPPRTIGPLDPGFANPLYDTAPFDDGNAREMELRSPIEEQPTFDISDKGFNNPLYGTAGAAFFTDPTEVPQTTVDVETKAAKEQSDI